MPEPSPWAWSSAVAGPDPDETRLDRDRSVGCDVPSCASWPTASRWGRRVREPAESRKRPPPV